MYYICKFSDSWSVYDGKKNISRPLEKNEIDCLKNLFPALLDDNSKILTAIQINSIQPNKLVQLPMPGKQGTIKKLTDNSSKPQGS
jgi:hypothetical protein